LDHAQPEHLLDAEKGTAVLSRVGHRSRCGVLPALQRGFTLLELMITIAFIGILFAIALPSFSTWIRNSQVRTVAEALQTGIRTAQTESVRLNRRVVLTFTNATPALDAASAPGGKNWSLQTVPRVGEQTATGTPAVAEYRGGGKLSDIASGVAIANLTTPSSSAICFNSNGRLIANSTLGCTASTTTFAVTQTNSDRNLNVIVAIGGQIRMCDPKRPALSDDSPDGCPP
jgi:type IV fimbrial biogenesis protein FimT